MVIISKEKSLAVFICNNSLFHFSRTLPGAVIVLLLLSNGVSIKAFTFAKALQLLTSALLTVPAGIFADRFGRKKSLIIACIAEIIYFILLMKPSNTNIIIGEFFNGICLCFYAGAYEGWLLDLNKQKHSKEFTHIILKASEYMFLFMMTASLIGAFLGTSVFLVSVIFLSIVTLLHCFIYEPSYLERKQEATNTDDVVKDNITQNNKEKKLNILLQAVYFLFQKKVGLFLLVSGALFTGLMQFVFQFWQPIIESSGVTSHLTFGAIFSATLFFQYLISIVSRKIVYKNVSIINALCFNWTIASISLIALILLLPFKIYSIVIALYVLFNGFMTSASNLVSVLSAKHIDKRYHATGLSVIDLVGRLLGAFFLFTIIPFISLKSIHYTWIFLAFVFLSLSFVTLFVLEKKYALSEGVKL